MDDSGAPLGFFGHLQILCAPNGRTAGSRLTRMRRRSCRISVAHLNVGQSWSPSLVLWPFLASSTDGEKRLPEVASKKTEALFNQTKSWSKKSRPNHTLDLAARKPSLGEKCGITNASGHSQLILYLVSGCIGIYIILGHWVNLVKNGCHVVEYSDFIIYDHIICIDNIICIWYYMIKDSTIIL